MWVDQPAGTGFSYSDLSGFDKHEKEVAEDMYHFLQAFFAKHTEFQGRPFFVFGESYGGHYAPAVSHRVFVGNQDPSNIWINLAGVAIGNGLTDPLIQYEYYSQLAYNYSMEKIGHPVISESTYELMVDAWPTCQSLIADCQNNTGTCMSAFLVCNVATIIPYRMTGLNPYDITKECGPNPLCYNFSNIGLFLNNPRVQAALGVNRTWLPCNPLVNLGFAIGGDWMKNYQMQIPDLLNNGTRVLIYAGDLDYMCVSLIVSGIFLGRMSSVCVIRASALVSCSSPLAAATGLATGRGRWHWTGHTSRISTTPRCTTGRQAACQLEKRALPTGSRSSVCLTPATWSPRTNRRTPLPW